MGPCGSGRTGSTVDPVAGLQSGFLISSSWSEQQERPQGDGEHSCVL